MAAKWTMELHFDEYNKDVDREVANAMDETMAACVNKAKSRVRVDTGALQGSIMFQPAEASGGRIHGEWGSYGIEYAIFQEIGPVSGARNWSFTPYLRPSADEEYPRLIDRIEARLKR